MLKQEFLSKEETEIVQFIIGNTKHYPLCKYVFEEKGCPTISGSVYEYRDIVSAQLNQLKAKLFNLIEGVCLNGKQQEALKGLVKGFCNTTFKQTTGDLTGLLQRLGFKVEDWDYSATHLETEIK